MRVKEKLLHNEHLELDGNNVHILSERPDDYEVWLNTDVGDFDGLCIGCGQTREEAVAGAVAAFDEGLRKLRGATQAASGD